MIRLTVLSSFDTGRSSLVSLRYDTPQSGYHKQEVLRYHDKFSSPLKVRWKVMSYQINRITVSEQLCRFKPVALIKVKVRICNNFSVADMHSKSSIITHFGNVLTYRPTWYVNPRWQRLHLQPQLANRFSDGENNAFVLHLRFSNASIWGSQRFPFLISDFRVY